MAETGQVEQNNKKRLALVVDDDEVNRIILQGMLHNKGFDVVTAENGKEAVEKFVEYNPTIILMDILMPVMDGYEATKQIKTLVGDRYVPVIFLTAVVEEDELAKCVRVGGDDFLSKPFSQVILMAKIEALSRMEALYSTIKKQRDAIDAHNEQLMLEQKVAKRIFSRVVHEGCLDIDNFRYILSPLSIFNGDLLLAARTPSGGLNVLLGDATGHGLPAAIGAVPISDIFYEMTENGATIDEIVLAVNSKLKNILPAEFFFCASILNLSNDFRLLTIWHGGLPDVLIYNQENRILTHKIPSTNFPLGVVDNAKLNSKPLVVELFPGDRIYLYSDGITETRNHENEQFGESRLLECFTDQTDADFLFDNIVNKVEQFRGASAQSDDITLLQITADKSLFDTSLTQTHKMSSLPQPRDWNVTMTLGPDDLRTTNPVSILTKFATNNDELVRHRENIFIILSELYNNALDHGILKLDSALKQKPEGFSQYLLLRQERLENLVSGRIKIYIKYNVSADDGGLLIVIEDDGHGFDYEAYLNTLGTNKNVFGRGIALVRSICTRIEYRDRGNIVHAQYNWGRGGKE